MLLEDYKYGEMPQTVANLLEFFQTRNITPDRSDIVVGFLHILMLETGFVDKNCTDSVQDCDFNYQRLLRHSKTLPQSWKRTSSYQMDFILNSCPHIACSIVCVDVSDDLQINCTIKDIAWYSLLVDPLTYFTSSKINLGSFGFQNLRHLSRNFKDSIAFPAKTEIVNTCKGICACFQHLPQELLVKIMCYLETEDVLRLAETCRDVCLSAQDSSLWVKLLHRDSRRKHIVK